MKPANNGIHHALFDSLMATAVGVPSDRRKAAARFFLPTKRFVEGATSLNRIVHLNRLALATLHTEIERSQSRGAFSEEELRQALTDEKPELRPLERVQLAAWVRDSTLEENVDALGPLILVFTVARYELWIDEMLDLHSDSLATAASLAFGGNVSTKKRSQFIRDIGLSLQFPTRPGALVESAKDAIDHLCREAPDWLTRLSALAQSNERVMTDAQLENSLKIYRLYKEIRNGIVHSGGRVSERAEAASAACVGMTKDDCGAHYLWPLPQLNAGEELPLVTTRDAIAFDGLLTLVVLSLDARLVASRGAQGAIVATSDLKELLANAISFEDPNERTGQLLSWFIVRCLGLKGVKSLPKAPSTSDAEQLFIGACSAFHLARAHSAIRRSAAMASGYIAERLQ